MVVYKSQQPFPNSVNPWSADCRDAVEDRPRRVESVPAEDIGDDEIPIPPVSSPPLIPRIFPGL